MPDYSLGIGINKGKVCELNASFKNETQALSVMDDIAVLMTQGKRDVAKFEDARGTKYAVLACDVSYVFLLKYE